jgi:DNA-binding SARP family transcriptional activator
MTASLRGEAFTLASLGDLASDLGATTQASDYYSKSNEISQQIDENFLKSYLKISSASLEIKNRKFKKAQTLLDNVESDLNDASELVRGWYYQEVGKLNLNLGQLDRSQTAFGMSQEIFRNIGMPVEFSESKLYQLIVLSQTQKEKDTKRHKKTHQSDREVSQLDTISPLVPEFSNQLDRLKNISGAVIGNIQIVDLIKEIEKFHKDLPQILEDIDLIPTSITDRKTYTLEIHALGRINIYRDGKKITASEWIHQKTVRELFFYLLSQPSGASKEEICTVFWPQSNPEQLKKQFKNALYRLRRSLGKDVVIYHQPTRLYHFNRNLRYWYDVEDFLEKTAAAENTESITKKIALLRKAADIYKHPFAPTLEGVWVEPERYRLQRMFESTMMNRIELLLSQELFDEALQTGRELLKVTPGHEAAWRSIMLAQSGKGNRTGVRRDFENCKRALRKYLDLEPAEETIMLYQEIMN